ncbi:hypothetical protein FG064_16530 [Vibrio cholerae]|uniref:hypothetical protein n=1 Tax=Vibrio cholerae TaxID=666 RepID=UPI0011D32156|nr:hypothetical protein [Vibrio cholerae]EGR0468604.1 hypothetical protein [Vibrio cholerae]TXY52017.1 hypothetical protein FXE74_18670 [Vibrio cholerae]GIB34690.1 hypothetical protein VCSRO91_3575 [Vibrio cholerae]
MYQINFESRSHYRYVAYFRSSKPTAVHFNSYFSVEVQVNQRDWGTLIDNNIQYTIQVCEIQEPFTMTYYKLVSYRYCVTGDDFITKIGKLLVEHQALQEGVPFQVNIELNDKIHSFIQMNAGCVYANEHTHFQTVMRLFNEFSAVTVNNEDEIEEDWLTFEKGTDRFGIWKWFEEKFGYPVNTLLTCAQKISW